MPGDGPVGRARRGGGEGKASTGTTSSSGTGAASENGSRPVTACDQRTGSAGQRTSPAAGEHCRVAACHQRSPSHDEVGLGPLRGRDAGGRLPDAERQRLGGAVGQVGVERPAAVARLGDRVAGLDRGDVGLPGDDPLGHVGGRGRRAGRCRGRRTWRPPRSPPRPPRRRPPPRAAARGGGRAPGRAVGAALGGRRHRAGRRLVRQQGEHGRAEVGGAVDRLDAAAGPAPPGRWRRTGGSRAGGEVGVEDARPRAPGPRRRRAATRRAGRRHTSSPASSSRAGAAASPSRRRPRPPAGRGPRTPGS